MNLSDFVPKEFGPSAPPLLGQSVSQMATSSIVLDCQSGHCASSSSLALYARSTSVAAQAAVASDSAMPSSSNAQRSFPALYSAGFPTAMSGQTAYFIPFHTLLYAVRDPLTVLFQHSAKP